MGTPRAGKLGSVAIAIALCAALTTWATGGLDAANAATAARRRLAPVSRAGTTAPTTASPSTTTTPSQPAPTTVSSTVPVSDFVTRQGAQLYLDGHPWTFTGINAPQAATDYAVNGGCGAQIDINALFASLAPNTVVRVGFGQDATVNTNTGQRDWRGLDRVVEAAERSPTHPRLIVGLTSQSGICDAGHWKDSAWYAGAYRRAFNDYHDGFARESYWQYIHEVIPRYRNSTAIAIWEPVGEPEAADCASGYFGPDCYGHKICPANATQVLRAFFDTVGAEIKHMDPAHLLGTAAIGGDQCGWAGAGGKVIVASPSLDVSTFHDYGSDSVPVTSWLQMRILEARALDKPIITEEVGIAARDGMTCPTSIRTRAAELTAKMRAGMAAGLSGFAIWAYGERGPVGCDDYVLPGDPALSLLHITAA